MPAETKRTDEWAGYIKRDLVTSTSGVRVEAVDGVSTVDVDDYGALVRVYGYVKFHTHVNVLMRGQAQRFGNLRPNGYRTGGVEHDARIDAFVEHFRRATEMDQAPEETPTTEPLLQHYGVRTRWLDVVDSIPHALYFAVHAFRPTKAGCEAYVPEDEYAWIYLIDAGSDNDLRSVRVLRGHRVVACRGVWETPSGFQLTDLRRAKPSIWLRPHAQHGYLCRPPPGQDDLWPRVLAQIRVPRARAAAWLGNGEALAHRAMFPDAARDTGFGTLLEAKVEAAFESWRAKNTGYDPGGITRYATGG